MIFLVDDGNTDWAKGVEERVNFSVTFGKKQGFIKKGDNVVLLTGWRKGAGGTNTVRIM
jgi:pyruvate kinase